MTPIEAAIERLGAAQWRIARAELSTSVPLDVISRYRWVPTELWSVLAQFSVACRADERMWLLVGDDYSTRNAPTWAWNAWELLSLESVEPSSADARAIRGFWDAHLPVAIAVDPYSYWALRADGNVVFGVEPDFEATTHVADSYLAFLELLAS